MTRRWVIFPSYGAYAGPANGASRRERGAAERARQPALVAGAITLPYIRVMSTISVADLLHLSVPERLQLVEDLWDSIAAEAAADPSRLPLDASLRQELRRRSEAYRRNPHEAMPLDEALDDIERSLG